MSNMPDVNKAVTFVRLPLELMAKLRSLARSRKITMTSLIAQIMHDQLDGLGPVVWLSARRPKFRLSDIERFISSRASKNF